MMDRRLPRIYSNVPMSYNKISAESLKMHCQGPLCNIVVDISPLLVPFHVILIDQSVLVSTVSHSHAKLTHFSMFFLMSAGSSTPLVFVAEMTSLTNSACVMVFLLFMILTIAACVS